MAESKLISESHTYTGIEIDGCILEGLIRKEKIGVVYKGYNKESKNYIACKLIPKKGITKEWKAKIKKLSFKLEGISQVIQYNYPIETTIDNKKFICVFTRFLEGKTLNQYIKENKREITISFIKFFAEEILHLFHAMQKVGIEHRALNTNNIFVMYDPLSITSESPIIKVTDFDYFELQKMNNNDELKDDFNQFALICQELLEIIDPAELDGKDRFFYDLFINDFLSKKILETDPTVGDYVRKPEELVRILNDIIREYQIHISANIQKFTDPFDYLRSEDIGNSFGLLQLLYKENFPGYNSLITKNNTVLTGPRGCGKTTIFRNLSLKTQILSNKIHSIDNYTEPFIGIYYHCNDLYFAFPYLKENITPGDREAIIHYFNLSILYEILDLLSTVNSIPGLKFDFDTEMAIEKELASNISFLSKPPIGTNAIRHFSALVLKEKVYVRKWFQNRDFIKPNFLPMDFIKNICHILHNQIPWMRERAIYFFLDDYSTPTISKQLQETLHDFIFFPSEGSNYFFKISTESIVSFHPFNSKGKVLEEEREYLTIDLGYFFRGNRKEGLNFIYDVVNNRLRNAEGIHEKYHDIKKILGKSGNLSCNEMARKIRKREHEIYYGHDMIMRLCSGDVAYILNLIKRIFESAGGSKAFRDPGIELPLDPKEQNKIVKETSAEFLDKIENIPKMGKQLRDSTEAFGKVAHWFLINRNSGNLQQNPPWQAYRMELRNQVPLSNDHKELYDGLLRYSILIRDTRGKSQRGVVAPRLYLRKLLIPTFRLTFSTRDNIGVNIDDFLMLLDKPDEFVRHMQGKRFKPMKSRAKKNAVEKTKQLRL